MDMKLDKGDLLSDLTHLLKEMYLFLNKKTCMLCNTLRKSFMGDVLEDGYQKGGRDADGAGQQHPREMGQV